MEAAISAPWADANLYSTARTPPLAIVLAGIDHSPIVDAALIDVAMPHFEPAGAPPCDALLWRLETASGETLNKPGLAARHWHRSPYALTLRLVQYQPGSVVPEILDEGTLGTRGPREAFLAAVDRLAIRLVRDAALGCARGPADALPAASSNGLPGWLDATRAKWHDRVMAEWWSVGTATATWDSILAGRGVGDITWYRTERGDRYLADPFPWSGTGRVLCEEMPLRGDAGRIVAVTATDERLTASRVLLDDDDHHSYPCTFRDEDTVYCVPETTRRGATRIYRLDTVGQLTPVCDPAPVSRLADPTLFRWNGSYWLACTDLDLGEHDNLCLLHAPAVEGPWTPHSRWPVKIDVRGARPAGTPFAIDGRLFRPAQDCASTYGGGVVIHEIQTLTETDFRESPVTVLRPDRSGPFPHGLHTLVHDGERFWLDGKRFVLDLTALRAKVVRRVSRVLSRIWVT